MLNVLFILPIEFYGAMNNESKPYEGLERFNIFPCQKENYCVVVT